MPAVIQQQKHLLVYYAYNQLKISVKNLLLTTHQS